jgi:4-hydroxybenzoate polyprenyltransferase
MNLVYCVRLKQIAVVDVFIIAIGFVLRVLIGGFATGIYISHWIVLMTFLLALFLAFAKRRDDVVMFESTGMKARKNVDRYNLDFMNQVIGVIASITMVCYIMYTVSEEVVRRLHCQYVYVTAIFVLAGIIRYLQVTIVDVKSGSPTKVLMKDRFLQLCILGWIATFAVILYF